MNESALFAITRLSMKSFSFPLIPPPFFSLPPPSPPPPPPLTPLPPPGWLMGALVFHQGIFARSFLHFFAVICRCQILARSTQGCDWQISPTPPLPALVTSWLLSSIQGHFLYFWSTLYHRSASITWDHHHHQHTVCDSENVKSVDITVCFVSLLTKCLKM